MSDHDHDPNRPGGRTVEALGLCEATDACRAQGHSLARTTLPRSLSDSQVASEICLVCTEVEGRLEGLRLWKSVCPCCFSSAFPEGLPSIETLHARTFDRPRESNVPESSKPPDRLLGSSPDDPTEGSVRNERGSPS
jgi:hypothetical protein